MHETERPDAATDDPDGDERCALHDNRRPCPQCLANDYGVYVWNSL